MTSISWRAQAPRLSLFFLVLLSGACTQAVRSTLPPPHRTDGSPGPTTQQPAGVRQAAFGQSLFFEENRGQFDSAVKFVSRGPGHQAFLTRAGAVLALPQGRLGIRLVGGALEPRLEGADELPGKVN